MCFDPNDPRITDYIFDELDGDQRAAFESELDGDQQLRDVVEETRHALDRLSIELKAEPEMAMSDAHRNAVAEEIAKAHAPSQPVDDIATTSARKSPSSGRIIAVTVALAASLLIVCGVAYSLRQQYRTGQDRHVAMAEVREVTELIEATAASDVEGESKPVADVQNLLEDIESASDAEAPNELTYRDPTTELQTQISQKNEELQRKVQTEGKLIGGHGLPAQAKSVVSSDRRHVRVTPMPLSPGVGGMAAPAPAAGGGYGSPGYGSEYGGSGYAAGAGGYGGRATGQYESSGTNAYGDAGGYGGDVSSPATPADPALSLSIMPTASNAGDSEEARALRRRLDLAKSHYMRALTGSGELQPGYGWDRGPGASGDKYSTITENPFKKAVGDDLLSTFSIDVDTASYSKVRMHLMEMGILPRPEAVRIEELVNYFTYDYAPPEDEVPFAAHIEVADCPWTPAHRLARIAIKGKEIEYDRRPTSNLVFLLDVSGSMRHQNKLPLVKHGMKMLVDQLGESDQVAIAVYAGAAGLVLDSTSGDQKQVVLDALDHLHAGGSTNGGEGIQLAYQTALDNFVAGGVNRVILCTDGDFNVGVTGTDELVRLAEENAKTGVFLSVLGFGMGNHNDAMLEEISNKGNGNYAFIDNEAEARKVLVEQMTGTLVTIAKDVKIQVDFNPVQVAAYRLIGYENRIMAAEDFSNDKKDAGEIGAGHTVTALYEIVPAGVESPVVMSAEGSRYWTEGKPSKAAKSGEMLMLRIRYKQPDEDTSELLEFPVDDKGMKFGQATKDFRFAAAVASFGMLLRDSQHKGNATYAGVLETATEAARDDASGYRDEFLRMVERAKVISGQ